MQPSSLCIKMASHARKSLQRILHLKNIAPHLPDHQELQGERWRTAVKKASRRPRMSSKRQDRVLLWSRLRNRVTTSAELDHYRQQVGVSASARIVRRRLLDNGLVSRRASKKALLSKVNSRKYKDWTAEDRGEVIFSDEAPLYLFETSREEKLTASVSPVSFQQWSILRPSMCVAAFHPRDWVLFQFCPKTLPWITNGIKTSSQEQVLPTIQEQFDGAFSQHDWAPCLKARAIMNRLGDHYVWNFGSVSTRHPRILIP